MKLSRGWQIALVFSLSAALILTTWLRIKNIGEKMKEVRSGFEETKNSLVGTEEEPGLVDAGKDIAGLIRELRSTGSQNKISADSAGLKLAFDPENIAHIIENKPVKLEKGKNSFGDRRINLENMTLIGDWNKDEKADFAGIISAVGGEDSTWYLSVILSGENPVALPAVRLSDNYPIVTGIAESKDNSISIIETAWKEQKSSVRVFKIGEWGIEEEK